MSGPVILDIGYKGGNENAVPVLPHAIGVDLDYPGYDGVRLPFADGSVDTVFGSHVLEHVGDARLALRDWFRVLRTGGFIVCVVPHQFLYERKQDLPSNWSAAHLRFYTPGTLLRDVEDALAPNSYRVRHLADNDSGYIYESGPNLHPIGCYEIELVIEKIKPPPWDLH
jgi:SAM-dependent methyltransferase